ncbi:MAG TPA: alpha/beta hydrolase-fold protein [Bryobacteraceae bacterium]|nr:alpha/beta hydrolase-fold protein [Bryobacteraceae bacterium]
MMRYVLTILLALAAAAGSARQPFHDRTHPSKVFGQPRYYRIFLPPAYETSGKAYPVIYYFHGHSDRYTLERYDNGTDTVPKITDFVAKHDVIVVAVDGFVAKNYTGFYGGSPWDLLENGGDNDFGEYFQELVAHIDSTYRTLTDRRHRATSGLSMGGFMSLWTSARYPHLIGSASAFNPGHEFYVGDKGRRTLWRLKDHAANHGHTMVRLIRASGDYISQYHEEMRDVYARAHEVDFEYRQDEYHRHWATSIGETFDFHMRAFAKSALDNVPEVFSHANPYRKFEVWGYRVEAEGNEPGITLLEGVRQEGLRVTTRRWEPDGPPVRDRRITITTPPLYQAGRAYKLFDHDLSAGKTNTREVTPDTAGRMSFTVDGAGHQVSFSGPGTGAEPPVLLPVTPKDRLRLPPGTEVRMPIRIYNPRGEAMTDVKVAVSSEYPTVRLVAETAAVPKIEPGDFVDLSDRLRATFTAGTGHFAPARLTVTTTFDGWHETSKNVDVLIIPEAIPVPLAVEILDGRTMTLNVFRQKGNQGGGGSISRTVTEGKGNGNGILEPGEEATIWVKLAYGMDPFDKNNWYRTKVYTDSPHVTEIGDIQEQKQLEWTSSKERTSLIRLSPDAPAGAKILLLLDNESWSYHYTPDVRYGTEKLYQAFQLHSRHLHRLELAVPRNPARPAARRVN